jgi:hypothetical protein
MGKGSRIEARPEAIAKYFRQALGLARFRTQWSPKVQNSVVADGL